MATLTAWKFSTPQGADIALEKLQKMQSEQLINVQDAAVVSWEVGRKKPKTRELHDTKKAGALGGGFWGLLFGLIFFVPILGLAIGAATGALFGSMADVGISNAFINDVQAEGHAGHLGTVPAQLGRRGRPSEERVFRVRGRAHQHQPVRGPGSKAPRGVRERRLTDPASSDPLVLRRARGAGQAGSCSSEGVLMESADYDDDDLASAQGVLIAQSWLATVILGAVTLILGLIVSFHPGGSLNVVAVLLGILAICSGIFHLVRIFGRGEAHRVWSGIVGLAFIVVGVVLIRHLHLTIALIGLYVGITWIVQGVTSLIVSVSGGEREGRGWWIFFGVVSLIAGIVVVATPVTSLTVLALLLGISFIIMGIIEIIGGLMIRHMAGAAADSLAAPAEPAVADGTA